MEDKTTPHLKLEGQQAVLNGSGFLTGREAYLQARLDELEAELVGLGDAPDDVESLESQALDALRSLSDLLEPQTPTLVPTPPPESIPTLPSAAHACPRRSEAGGHRRPWRVAVIIAALLVVGLAALLVVWMYGPDRTRDSAPATTAAQAASTPTRIPPTPSASSPTRPPATATPIPSPTIVAPVIPETPGRTREAIQAETVQILDISGTLRLELPLTLMADTVRMVEGLPVLQPVLPASGAGVHRGSAPFGEVGAVIIAIPTGSAPATLWRVQPGDRLIGCNGDDACHDYQVIAADTWPLERLQQLLRDAASYAAANRPMSDTVLLYTAVDQTTAWVVQAQPWHEEGAR